MIDLTPYNTLRVSAQANNLLEINTPSDLQHLDTSSPFMFLGEGANILFTSDYPGTIAKVNLSGFKVIKDTDLDVLVEAQAGQNWHDFVIWASGNGWWGLQNMAYIPGSVGAAAVGNIAAYGGNQEDSFHSLTAIDLSTHKSVEFSKSDCQFSYRESIFKHKYSSKYLITNVRYLLTKNDTPDITYHSRYESLSTELKNLGKSPNHPLNIAEAVINLRKIKQPDWTAVGTAGSFFKNPVVTKSQYQKLASEIEGLQWYPVEKLSYHDESEIPPQVKIPAGRLLDELGWKSKRLGAVSTHDRSALVIINLGGATGQEIYSYSQAMHQDVLHSFGINLEYEVIVV